MVVERKQKIGLLFRIKGFLQYGISNAGFHRQDITRIITTFLAMYYRAKEAELTARIAEIENFLQSIDDNLLGDLCDQSMALLRDKLAIKYMGKDSRVVFCEEDLWKNPYDVLNEYPVLLSTTFSSRNSLKEDVVYDYLIMDEASQVDIATGALALSCARNVVIVGDTKQLPNVVTDDVRLKALAIFNNFNIDEGYQFTKSFLFVTDKRQGIGKEYCLAFDDTDSRFPVREGVWENDQFVEGIIHDVLAVVANHSVEFVSGATDNIVTRKDWEYMLNLDLDEEDYQYVDVSLKDGKYTFIEGSMRAI